VYTGDPGCFRGPLQRIATRTPAQVKATAAKWLRSGDHTLSIVPGEVTPIVEEVAAKPAPSSIAAADPKFKTVASDVDRAQGVPVAKEFPALSFPALQRATLKHGTMVSLAERHDTPVVLFNIVFPGGFTSEGGRMAGTASFAMNMLDEGAGDYDAIALGNRQEQLGAVISASSGLDSAEVSLSALKENLAPSLALWSDMILRPRFEEAALGPARDLALQAIESLKDDPTERAMIGARARHFPAPLDRSTLGTPEGIAAITRDDVVRRWAERARPVGSILGIAGAVDADLLAERLNQLLAGWTGAAAPYVRGVGAARGYAHEPDETNQVQIVTLSDAPAEPDASSMLEKVVINVLSGGMSGRLFTEVREKRGLCYSVSAGYSSGKEFGSIVGYVGTTPERAQTSLDVLVAEMERINTPAGKIEPSEFDRAIIGM
jgi:predicted Zn-dependent peptidase